MSVSELASKLRDLPLDQRADLPHGLGVFRLAGDAFRVTWPGFRSGAVPAHTAAVLLDAEYDRRSFVADAKGGRREDGTDR